MAKILVVEDERDIVVGLAFNLKREGHAVVHTARGDVALGAALREQPDLILLDVMLPGKNGLDVCRELRAKGVEVPIIMLTARAEELDRVLGLEIGADDYLTKPFGVRELIARINVRLRRAPARPCGFVGPYRFGTVEVDFDAREVRREGRPVELSPKELELLQFLLRHRGQVVGRERMLKEVWGFEQAPTSRTIDTHVLRLRQKLEEDSANPRHILSVYGEGYKFVE
jgi:DNA-binding response OmpR family regulator